MKRKRNVNYITTRLLGGHFQWQKSKLGVDKMFHVLLNDFVVCN